MDTNTNNEVLPGGNTGLLEVLPRPGDFVAGAETAISHVPVMPNGDWTPYFPPGEWQKDMAAKFETDACVSFSACDSMETYANWAIANGRWTDSAVQFLRDNGYFNPDGKTLNFSDRYVARMSNTTTDGNSFPNVGDTIRHFGLVPETVWPFPTAAIEANPANAWAIYYTPVPANVQAIGQEFLKHFSPQYEWVKYPGLVTNLANELEISPLWIGTEVCPPWNTSSPIQACGPGCQHGTMLGRIEAGGQADILDHYQPFVKHFAPGYDITYALRFVLTPIANMPIAPESFHYTFTKQLTYKGTNDATELHALQTALQTLKRQNGQAYMTPGLYGIFGDATRAALDLFERDNHIPDPQPGQNFGPRNRAVMNTLLTK